MDKNNKGHCSRREFTAAAVSAAAFTIVPRHVLGGPGFTPPSDKINLAVIGLGRQGMAVMMNLLQLPEIQVVSVCDVNQGSKEYAEYDSNAMLTAARRLLGAGFENWGEDWASPGTVQLTKSFSTSLGIGGREPAKRLAEAYYSSRNGSESYKGCAAYMDFLFFFKDPATPDIYTLSLHDALPIYRQPHPQLAPDTRDRGEADAERQGQRSGGDLGRQRQHARQAGGQHPLHYR